MSNGRRVTPAEQEAWGWSHRSNRCFLDDEEASRYRAYREGDIVGVIDGTNGEFVLRTADVFELPRQTEPLACEMASMMRGEREIVPANKRSRRHRVKLEYSRYARRHEVMLCDMSRARHGPWDERYGPWEGFLIAFVPVDQDDEAAVQAAKELMLGFAEQLNAHPLDWTAMRRKPKKQRKAA